MVEAPKPIAPSIISTPPTIGPPKSAEIAANEPAFPSTALSCAPSRARRVISDPDDCAERDQRPLWTEHRTERERADRGERDPGRVREQRRLPRETVKRAVAAVARQEAAGDRDDACPGHGQADDQVPGRRRLAQVLWQVVPEPVLEVVHDREEATASSAAGIPTTRPEALGAGSPMRPGPTRHARRQEPSPPIASPISFAPSTSSRTVMIAALFAAIHCLISSSSAAPFAPIAK